MFTLQERKYLLSLARRTLERCFVGGRAMDPRPHFREGMLDGDDKTESEEGKKEELSDGLKEKRGTFVTLKKNKELRGCIGHIEPVQEIYKDVIDNALAAAFEDTRFLPLKADELPEVGIEISVLTEPQELKYSSADDLLAKLTPLRDGVIIKKGSRGATYLPQVWEDFASPNPPAGGEGGMKDKAGFLSSLCLKAGLPAEEWKRDSLEVWTYQAEVFSEISNSPNF